MFWLGRLRILCYFSHYSFVLSISLAICLCFGCSLHLGLGIGSRVGFLFLFGSTFSRGLFGIVRNMWFMFYGGFSLGMAVLIADFSVFSLAYLCGSVWGNGARFGTSIFLFFVILVIKGVFYFLRIPFPLVVGLFLSPFPFPFWLQKSHLLKHFLITGIY